MAMTIKVYEVDRYGRTRVVRPTTEVVPLGRLPMTADYPACECDRCGGRRPAGQAALAGAPR
ncbi:hypothetical protein [Streptomyces sp. NPDC014734]|uniref:hypothetical protein n=1 Tax=Streptomyces sp. NPDC014734 TaxID=3364886 RepID=UPI003701F59B